MQKVVGGIPASPRLRALYAHIPDFQRLWDGDGNLRPSEVLASALDRLAVRKV